MHGGDSGHDEREATRPDQGTTSVDRGGGFQPPGLLRNLQMIRMMQSARFDTWIVVRFFREANSLALAGGDPACDRFRP